MAARDLETEASWKTVSASTAASLPSSRTPNPPAKVDRIVMDDCHGHARHPGLPQNRFRQVWEALNGQRCPLRRDDARAASTVPAHRRADSLPGPEAGPGRPLAAPRPMPARPAPARVNARRRVTGRPNATVPDSAAGLFISAHLPFQGTSGRLRRRHDGSTRFDLEDQVSRTILVPRGLLSVCRGGGEAEETYVFSFLGAGLVATPTP